MCHLRSPTWIRQRLVGVDERAEAVGCEGVSVVAIGMVEKRKPPEGAPNVRLGGAAFQPERGVVISHRLETKSAQRRDG